MGSFGLVFDTGALCESCWHRWMDNGPCGLCDSCWDRMAPALTPPRRPDAVARCAQWLRLVFDTRQQAAASASFPPEVRTLLATYRVWWFMP